MNLAASVSSSNIKKRNLRRDKSAYSELPSTIETKLNNNIVINRIPKVNNQHLNIKSSEENLLTSNFILENTVDFT